MEQQTMQIRHADDIPFVEEQKLNIAGKTTKYCAIVEHGTNDTLGIGTDRYSLVQHRKVYETVKSIKGIEIVGANLFKYGSKLVIEIEPNTESKVELLPNDYLQIRARIFNSYDGSTSVAVLSTGLRLVCTNGMVAPGSRWIRSKVHTGGNIDTYNLVNNIKLGMSFWKNSASTIRKSAKTTIETDVGLFHVGLPDKYNTIARENLKPKDTIYNIWNEQTNIISHKADNLTTPWKQQQQCNKIFDFTTMTESQVQKIAKALDQWNKKHNTE